MRAMLLSDEVSPHYIISCSTYCNFQTILQLKELLYSDMILYSYKESQVITLSKLIKHPVHCRHHVTLSKHTLCYVIISWTTQVKVHVVIQT